MKEKKNTSFVVENFGFCYFFSQLRVAHLCFAWEITMRFITRMKSSHVLSTIYMCRDVCVCAKTHQASLLFTICWVRPLTSVLRVLCQWLPLLLHPKTSAVSVSRSSHAMQRDAMGAQWLDLDVHAAWRTCPTDREKWCRRMSCC